MKWKSAPGSFWSAEEIATLRDNWGVLRSWEIAALVNKTGSAVIGKANRMGLHPVSTEQRIQFIRMTRRERLAREVM